MEAGAATTTAALAQAVAQSLANSTAIVPFFGGANRQSQQDVRGMVTARDGHQALVRATTESLAAADGGAEVVGVGRDVYFNPATGKDAIACELAHL